MANDLLATQQDAGTVPVKRKGGRRKGQVDVRPRKETPRKMDDYDQEVAETICERIANGEALNSVCNSLDLKQSQVYRWMRNDDAFAGAYALARVQRADVLVESATDELLRAQTRDEAQIAEIRSRQFLRIAAMVNPAKYSEKILHAHAHAFAGPMASVNIVLGGESDD